MQKILLLLNDHEKVIGFRHTSPPTSSDVKLHELVITFTDLSKLHVREIQKQNQRKYSYHWQSKENDLIVRWDTAPHHPNLETFPHHKHNPNLKPSGEITLQEVLEYIFDRI